MADRVGHQLIDEQGEDRRLTRGNLDVTRCDVELDPEAGRDQRAVRLVRDVPGDDVDGGSSQAALVAEKVMHGGNGLHAADGLSQVNGPGRVLLLAEVDGQQRGHRL